MPQFRLPLGYLHWMSRSRKERPAAKKAVQLNQKVRLEGARQLCHSIDLTKAGTSVP
tara:strand:+ start:2781 stop:2951 length:171 start_codon:yes stop_codon:yes gene_type:complete